MKLTPPKILVRQLNMEEYAPEFVGILHVWANPPRSFLEQWDESKFVCQDAQITDAKELLEMTEESDSIKELNKVLASANGEAKAEWTERSENHLQKRLEAQIVWVSKLWSQGPEDTCVSEDEVRRLVEETRETDPALFAWMISHSLEIIREHRNKLKKN